MIASPWSQPDFPAPDCTPDAPCPVDNRCPSCAADLALLSRYCDPYATTADFLAALRADLNPAEVA